MLESCIVKKSKSQNDENENNEITSEEESSGAGTSMDEEEEECSSHELREGEKSGGTLGSILQDPYSQKQRSSLLRTQFLKSDIKIFNADILNMSGKDDLEGQNRDGKESIGKKTP